MVFMHLWLKAVIPNEKIDNRLIGRTQWYKQVQYLMTVQYPTNDPRWTICLCVWSRTHPLQAGEIEIDHGGATGIIDTKFKMLKTLRRSYKHMVEMVMFTK